MLTQIYGAITKKNLEYQGNIVKERFNKAGFKAKRSGFFQKINRVEVIEHGTAVYFWCSHMSNFIVYGDSKKGTYDKLNQMFMYISLHEHDTYIKLSDFIVRR